MNILITGGAGFIGANLAEYHLKRGDNVVVVDDLSAGRFENVKDLVGQGQLRVVIADFLQWEHLCMEVAKADLIYHMAAVVGMFRVIKEPTTVMRINVCGTERLLQCAADCGSEAQIVIASSSSVYGHHQHIHDLSEDNDLIYAPEDGGLMGYALSKLANEVQAKAYHREYGLRVIIPRFFNVVGPRQTGTYGYVVPRFVQQAQAGRPLTVFGDGTQIRSFCNVRDTIRALQMLLELGEQEGSRIHGEVVNVGNDREISILDLAKLVIERADSDSGIEFIPFDQAYGEHFDQITQRHPNLEKITRLTGFVPAWTLEETIDDLLNNNLTGGIPQCALT